MASTAAAVPAPPSVDSGPSSADRFMQRLLRVDPQERQRKATVARAQRAMSQSIVISALRCILTYLVIPLAGPTVDLVGSAGLGVGIVLALLGILSSTRSMRAFWASNHRYRWHYSVFAAIIMTYLSISLVWDVARLLS